MIKWSRIWNEADCGAASVSVVTSYNAGRNVAKPLNQACFMTRCWWVGFSCQKMWGWITMCSPTSFVLLLCQTKGYIIKTVISLIISTTIERTSFTISNNALTRFCLLLFFENCPARVRETLFDSLLCLFPLYIICSLCITSVSLQHKISSQ